MTGTQAENCKGLHYVNLKCVNEAVLTMFSHSLKTDMPGTSPQTRQRLSQHFETNVMFLYSYELHAPNKLSILSQISR